MEDKVNGEFEKFYDRYEDKIYEYYDELSDKRGKKLLISFIITLGVVFLSIFLTLGRFDISDFGLNIRFDLEYKLLYFVAIFIFFIVLYIAGLLSLKEERYKITEKILNDMVKFISHDQGATYDYGKQIAQKNIDDMELFDLNQLKYRGENCILANYNNNPMSFCDIETYYLKDKVNKEIVYDAQGRKYLRTTKRKIKKSVFSGCYISARLNKKIADHIFLIPNNIRDVYINGKVLDYIKYHGEKMNLENLEFSKKYKVYSDEEVQARYVLSLSLMEKINKIDDIFPGKKYIVFKEGVRFAICLEDYKIDNLRRKSIPLYNNDVKVKSNLEYMYKELSKLFSIYDILDLGNDVFLDNH